MLLTIAVPTYNRLNLLRKLVNHLLSELQPDVRFSESIEVLICNNASTDGTTHFLNTIQAPGLRVINHDKNLGGDFNVRSCFESALGDFVWIIGDDDLPMVGAVSVILTALRSQSIDLLFLRHRWENQDLSYQKDIFVKATGVERVTQMLFARCVGAHITFISAFVVNKKRFVSLWGADSCQNHAGSNLPHLAWVLPLLRFGADIFVTDDIVITARGNNSGGYSVPQTFGVNLIKILNYELEEESILSKVFRLFIFAKFLPIWVYRAKYSLDKKFLNDVPWHELNNVNGKYFDFLLFVRSMRFLNRPAAMMLVILGRIYFRVKLRFIY